MVVKSMCHSCRRPGFNSQNLQATLVKGCEVISQPFIALIPGNPTPTFVFLKPPEMNVVHIIHGHKTLIYVKIK